MAKKKAGSRLPNNSFAGKLLSSTTPFAIREAYSTLRTNLLFTGKGEKCPIFVVTSAMPNDGKTVTSINLAISFAQFGKKVLLLDGDLRNSYMHRYFSLSANEGLSEYLAGMRESITIMPTKVENLLLVTSGAVPPNPAELLGSERMRQLLKQLREDFDYIFIDSPPVEMVADATVLADMVNGYLFVVKSGSSDVNAVGHALMSLQQVNGKVSGFVLSNMNAKSGGYSKLYSKYGYSKFYSKYGYSKYGYSRSNGYSYGSYGRESEQAKK